MAASPTPGGEPHVYWRIRYTSTQSGSYCSAGEIEMAATVGGADQCSGGTGFATATGGGSAVSYAFDNNPATAWYSFAPPQAVGYAFPSAVSVVSVRITAENGNFAGPSASPKSFTIEHSDNGSSWVVAATVTGQPDWTAGEVRTFNL